MHFMVDMARDLAKIAREDRAEAAGELAGAIAEALVKVPRMITVLEKEWERGEDPPAS